MRLFALTAALCCSCAAPLFRPPPPEVTVVTLEVDFPTRERGVLHFALAPVHPPPVQIAWELFVEGAPLASGVEAVSRPEGAIDVQTPLVTRHLSWREGETSLEVRLKGQAVAAPGAPGLRFDVSRRVQVHGRPSPGVQVD